MIFNYDYTPSNNLKNYFKFYRNYINNWVLEITQINGVEGLVFLGGLGKKGYLDRYSDIDIVLFINKTFDTKLIYPFEFHHKFKNKLIEYNLRTLYIDVEFQSVWGEEKKEAYSHADIIFDKSGQVGKLLKEKTYFDENLYFDRLVLLQQQYTWKKIHSYRSQKRRNYLCSHDLIYECLEILIEIIYILNNDYRNHKKWRLQYVSFFKILPVDFAKKLENILIVKNLGYKEFTRRFNLLDSVYSDLNIFIYKLHKNFPKNPYEYYYRKYNQPVVDTNADKILRNLNIRISEIERTQLLAFMCLNFIRNKKELLEKIHNNRKLVYKLDSKISAKIISLCHQSKIF